jgi:hypothetical protein
MNHVQWQGYTLPHSNKNIGQIRTSSMEASHVQNDEVMVCVVLRGNWLVGPYSIDDNMMNERYLQMLQTFLKTILDTTGTTSKPVVPAGQCTKFCKHH